MTKCLYWLTRYWYWYVLYWSLSPTQQWQIETRRKKCRQRSFVLGRYLVRVQGGGSSRHGARGHFPLFRLLLPSLPIPVQGFSGGAEYQHTRWKCVSRLVMILFKRAWERKNFRRQREVCWLKLSSSCKANTTFLSFIDQSRLSMNLSVVLVLTVWLLSLHLWTALLANQLLFISNLNSFNLSLLLPESDWQVSIKIFTHFYTLELDVLWPLPFYIIQIQTFPSIVIRWVTKPMNPFFCHPAPHLFYIGVQSITRRP